MHFTHVALCLFSTACVGLRMGDKIQGALAHGSNLRMRARHAMEPTWGADDLFLAKVASSCATGLLNTMDVCILSFEP
jgi:hypothetical protein